MQYDEKGRYPPYRTAMTTLMVKTRRGYGTGTGQVGSDDNERFAGVLRD